jgi:hypothetical protein
VETSSVATCRTCRQNADAVGDRRVKKAFDVRRHFILFFDKSRSRPVVGRTQAGEATIVQIRRVRLEDDHQSMLAFAEGRAKRRRKKNESRRGTWTAPIDWSRSRSKIFASASNPIHIEAEAKAEAEARMTGVANGCQSISVY